MRNLSLSLSLSLSLFVQCVYVCVREQKTEGERERDCAWEQGGDGGTDIIIKERKKGDVFQLQAMPYRVGGRGTT